MPSTPRPLKVFLCHAHADKSAVRNLYRHLKERKIDAWLDAEKLLPGQNWQVEILKALLSSDVIVICLSKNSVDKEGYVQKEIKFALDKALEMPEGRIFLIPARLEECELPQSLSTIHYVNLFEKDGYKRLLRSLRTRAEQIGATKIGQITHVSDHEETKVSSIDIGRDVSDSNIIAENSNVIHVTPQPVGWIGNPTREDEHLDQLSSLTNTQNEESWVATPAYDTEKAERNGDTHPKAEIKNFKKQLNVKFLTWSIVLLVLAIFAFVIWDISRPRLGVGSFRISEIDGMTMNYVPEGNFTMGSDYGFSDEKPARAIYLDAFWIDQTEVTNKQYAACVSGGGCTLPSNTSSYMRTSYYGNSEFDEFPVIYVNWNQANAYCSWAGRELPSEAQWEKAARGIDARIFPWGNGTPNDTLLNYSQRVGDTTKVNSYEMGKSIYGAYDMAGNSWEWVNDWYSEIYYQSSPSSNPLGPDTGQYRVLRGGAWFNYGSNVRSAVRSKNNPTNTYSFIGFRCAHSFP
jgi:formylglycine-generating enzyme required for sulfatase activity